MLGDPADNPLAESDVAPGAPVGPVIVREPTQFEGLGGLVNHPVRCDDGVHQVDGGPGHLFEYLILRERGRDDGGQAVDGVELGDSGLQAGVQARILDGDSGLVGEQRDQPNVVVRETRRVLVVGAYQQHTYQVSSVAQRDAEPFAHAADNA